MLPTPLWLFTGWRWLLRESQGTSLRFPQQLQSLPGFSPSYFTCAVWVCGLCGLFEQQEWQRPKQGLRRLKKLFAQQRSAKRLKMRKTHEGEEFWAVLGTVGSVKQAEWAPTAFGRSELLAADRILRLNCFCGRAVWWVCGCIRNRAATDSRGGMIDTKSSWTRLCRWNDCDSLVEFCERAWTCLGFRVDEIAADAECWRMDCVLLECAGDACWIQCD